jgi:hypothetical protein
VVEIVDLFKPALVLDVDGVSDPSELNASGFGHRHIDRPAVGRPNPRIAKPAIGWDVVDVPQLKARSVVRTEAVAQ